MFKLAFIFLLAIAGMHSATLMERFPINYSPKRSIMTLLTQVESKLKNGGPLDAIQRMLSDFETEVNEEQGNHDQLWAEQQAECEDEKQFREQEIQNAQAALNEAQETLDGCQGQLIRAEDDLNITNNQLINNRQLLAQVEDAQRRARYDFETWTTAYQVTSRAVEECLAILDEIWSGDASFLQLSKTANHLLKQAITVKKAHHLTGVMAALVQLSNKDIQADDALLNQVKSLITAFGEKLEKEYNEYAAAFEAATVLYEQEVARLNETIENLTAQKAGLEAEISELKKCIATQQSIVLNATLKRDRNQRLLDDANNLCEAVEEEYHTATAARKEELELLKAIGERVEKRFSQLSEGVKERGKQDEFVYSDPYKYDDQEFVPSI